VEAPSKLFVRGRGLESEWGGAITVRGEAAEPALGGQIRLRRGFLDLLNRRFTVREGVVAFAGGSPIPVLNLEAAARTEDVQAVVTLRGPATDPKVSLKSEPELPQDEILSRVLFGRSVDRITPVQGLRLAAAVNQLRGGSGGVGGVLDAVRNAAGVDTLDVGAGATPEEASAKVGKYISDKVFLELQRGVQAGSGKARVEVELTPNLSVGTEITEQSQTGVDLEWRYDY
jgi:translocation and assembly module TamB